MSSCWNCSKSLPCSVILSGYPSTLYDDLLGRWRSLELQVMNQAGVRTEKLWFNFTPDRVHWPAYAGRNFTRRQSITCYHALCHAHHLRELERAWEQDQQPRAKQLQALLREINKAVDEACGVLNTPQAEAFRERYRHVLKAVQTEYPPPDESQRKKGQRGRLKRSKSRNLLERLIQFEGDALRFMVERDVPFTNNQGERDLRMSKVQQKISGCFRSELGAKIFARIRSYLSTWQKNGVSSEQALRLLYEGRWPDFMGITPE